MTTSEELAAVVTHIKENGLSEEVITQLRQRFNTKHFTYCTEDDINVGQPVADEETFAVYVVDSREHCSKLTTDLEHASGYVIAEYILD